jgi:hypothetical protein
MYSLGGLTGGTTVVATADKTDCTSLVSSAVTSANVPTTTEMMGACANPSVAAYYCGGRTDTTASDQSTGNKLVFATDTTSVSGSSALSQARAQLAGISERTTKGYFAGGLTGGAGVKQVTADMIVFSTDTTSAAGGANLSLARANVAGMSEGSTKGYWGGGVSAGAITGTKQTDKITFASDSTSHVASADISTARFGVFAGGDGSTKGFWGGGQTGAPVSTTDKIVFSTDTTSATATAWQEAAVKGSDGASGSDGVTLLAAGGNWGNVIGGFNFSTETFSSSGTLSQARTRVTGATTAGL